ncbi:hypothetical protein NQ315_016059 [Exocentrus adspersus]|uniref:Double jelly roll-like domain-containing protein n=1 Tax=Exocentrus adspersus TaxID=1586481 RepID=A0AAV8VLJ5_9CUCU|nr:hypothetical protein NQ315_016059 [Exocentrus adspersus]
MPHKTVAIPQQLALTKILDKNKEILMSFRRLELIELPSLSENMKHMSPEDDYENGNPTTCKFFVIQKDIPSLFVDFENNKFATLYEMFVRFRQAYYENWYLLSTNSSYKSRLLFSNPSLKRTNIYSETNQGYRSNKVESISEGEVGNKTQEEAIQSGAVILRIELETKDNVPKDTAAYCLVLHDKLYSYNSLTKIGKQ